MRTTATMTRLLLVVVVLAVGAAAPAAAQDDLLIEPAIPEAQPLDFGTPLIGSSARKNFIATNRTDQPVADLAVTQNAGDGAFGLLAVDLTSCPAMSGAGLAPGTSCSFALVWRPLALGPVTQPAQWSVQFATPPTTFTGVTAYDVRGGGRAFGAPAGVDFRTVTVGSISPAASLGVEILTPTFLAATNLRVRIEGEHRDDFVVARDECTGESLRAPCRVAIRFTPSAAGSRKASAVVTDRTTGDTRTVALSGRGELPPAATSPVVAPTPPAVVAPTPVSGSGPVSRPAKSEIAGNRVTCRPAKARRKLCVVVLARRAAGRYRVLRRGRVVARGTLRRRAAWIRLARGRYTFVAAKTRFTVIVR
jgi:hypothetical protein